MVWKWLTQGRFYLSVQMAEALTKSLAPSNLTYRVFDGRIVIQSAEGEPGR